MIDESCGMTVKKQTPVGVRTRVMDALQLQPGALIHKSPIRRVSELGWICRYTMDHGWSTKPRKPMNVNKLSDEWVAAIVGMCQSHDKAGYDAHDAKADELLGPLLAAPVKQVREFYHAVLEKMRAEPKVPFLVWISFEAWGEAFVKNAPDEGVKRLKKKLAREISELVEEPVAEQLPKAIQRALQWRDEEELKDVKEALEEGAKPKLVGRQSCLFLETKTKKGELVSVMI